MAASDAMPVPRKNVPYRVTFPIYDGDGDLVSDAANLDSQISGDGNNFTDCVNEATEIPVSSGMYYLDLTAAEMNYRTVAIIIKTSTFGAKAAPIVIYPEESGDIRTQVDTVSSTAVGDIANGTWDEVMADHLTAGTTGAKLNSIPGLGSGSSSLTYILTSTVDGSPIADAYVYVTTDLAGNNLIASGRTDAFGTIKFLLDPGAYYVWRAKSGWTFINPDLEVVL